MALSVLSGRRLIRSGWVLFLFSGWLILSSNQLRPAAAADHQKPLGIPTPRSIEVSPNPSEYQSLAAVSRDGTNIYWSDLRTLLALTPDLGTNWLLETGLLNQSIPSVGASGLIYVAAANGDAVAVAPEGEIVWRFKSGELPSRYDWTGDLQPDLARPHPIALTSDETLFISPSTSSNVYVVRHGTLLRRIDPNPSGTVRRRSPIIGPDDTIYLPSTNGYSAETPSGEVKWSAPFQRPVAIDSAGRLYSFSGNYISCVDFNGQHLWTRFNPAPVRHLLIGEGGRVFASSTEGLTAYTPEGDLLWTNNSLLETKLLPGATPFPGVFVPLNDGGARIVKNVYQPNAETPFIFRYTQRIAADGTSGPATTVFTGFSRWGGPGFSPPVVDPSGRMYLEAAHAFLIISTLLRPDDPVPVAHSSWPTLWGNFNTGRASLFAEPPILTVHHHQTNLTLRAGYSGASTLLERSLDLQHWSSVQELSAGSIKTILPTQEREFFRLRIPTP